jgi:hypothetical protein
VAGPLTQGKGVQSRPGMVVVVEDGNVAAGATDPTVTVVFRSARSAVHAEAINMTTAITTSKRGSLFDTPKA